MGVQPERIGRYEIHGLIGQGGMGKVYRARDPWMDRLVAIKTIEIGGRPEDRDEIRKRVLREIRACGRLTHPNIVQVFDVGQQEELAYLVMELVDGGELMGKKPPEEAVDILSQVAQALDVAHEQGIIHRDIKPGNILIDGKGNAKVLDFGIARVLDEQSLTKTGMTAGTPHYMPPEQLRAEKIGPAADQYALAVTAYELLTGEKPFKGDSFASLMYAVVNEEPRPMQGVPGRVEEVMKKGLAKVPEERYRSCADHVKALAEGLRQQSDSRKPATPSEPSPRLPVLDASGEPLQAPTETTLRTTAATFQNNLHLSWATVGLLAALLVPVIGGYASLDSIWALWPLLAVGAGAELMFARGHQMVGLALAIGGMALQLDLWGWIDLEWREIWALWPVALLASGTILKPTNRTKLVGGSVLLALGTYFLAENLGLIRFRDEYYWGFLVVTSSAIGGIRIIWDRKVGHRTPG